MKERPQPFVCLCKVVPAKIGLQTDGEYVLMGYNVLISMTRMCKRQKKEITMRNPGVAAVLSAIIPGVGQFYNGRILAGILWLIITPGCGSARVACSVGSATSSRPILPTHMRGTIADGLGNDRAPAGRISDSSRE
jgi:TM2 domain-containing membrane protein YozV